MRKLIARLQLQYQLGSQDLSLVLVALQAVTLLTVLGVKSKLVMILSCVAFPAVIWAWGWFKDNVLKTMQHVEDEIIQRSPLWADIRERLDRIERQNKSK